MKKDTMYRSIEDLIRIVNAGGGVTVDGTRPVEELMRLAMAVSAGTAKLVIAESDYKTTDDLVRIAKAGGGKVAFE